MPTTPKLNVIVLSVLGSLAVVAVFAVADPMLRAVLVLGLVFGGYLTWSRTQ